MMGLIRVIVMAGLLVCLAACRDQQPSTPASSEVQRPQFRGARLKTNKDSPDFNVRATLTVEQR